MDNGALPTTPATADPAKQRTRLDPGSGHPDPEATDGGSAHEQDRARALLVRLAVLDGEPGRPVRFQGQVIHLKGGGFADPEQTIGHEGEDCRVPKAREILIPVGGDGGGGVGLGTTECQPPVPGPGPFPFRRIPARTRPVSGPAGEGCPVVLARKRTAAQASEAEAGEAPASCKAPRYSASC